MSTPYNPHLKALLIGINYANKPYLRLQGCTNDVGLAKDYLISHLSADPKHITCLEDPPRSWDGKEWSSFPTRENMVLAISRFLASGEQGDVLLLHYSGHGTQIREKDGKVCGEALVPLDAEDTGTNFNNLLRDTEFEKLIAEKTPSHVTLYIVLDCCYGGGDIEKLGIRSSFAYNALGTHVRAAIPRGVTKRDGEIHDYPSMESRLRALSSSKPNVVVFVGGSKFEPVVETTLNFAGYGAFSYFFYQTLKANKFLRNINLIDTVRTNIRNAGFFQQPQLIASRDEICIWNFLTSVPVEENTNIKLPSFGNASRMDAKQIQEWQMIDAAATLAVNQEVGTQRKRGGKWTPFVVEDIARIIAGISGRTVLKIAQQQKMQDNAAFSLALIAIRDSVHRALDMLLPPSPLSSSNGAKKPFVYPTMQDMISTVVLASVRGTVASQLPLLKLDDAIFRDIFVPNTNAALSQHVGRAINLADEIRDIPIATPDKLAETREIIDNAMDLAKQVIVTICAGEFYTASLSSNSSSFPSDVTPLANEITKRLGQTFNNEFVSRLISAPDPQRKIEKLCLDILQGINRDYKVAIFSQDLSDRVGELTSRFGGFVRLSPPAGQALLRARRKGTQVSAVALAETLVGSICACAVDDAVFERSQRQLPVTSPVSLPAAPSRFVPNLVKVTANSVAELAAHAVLDALKVRNAQNINFGALCGVLRTVAKSAASKTLDILGVTQSTEAGVWNWGAKGDINTWSSQFSGSLPGFASIAVDAARTGLNTLSVRYPGSTLIGADADQLIFNNNNVSVPRYLRFLPYLDTTAPLLNAGVQVLGSPQGKRAESWDMANHGAEVLATSFASLMSSWDASVEPSVAISIVKDAVAELALKTPEHSLVENVTESLQNALKKRSTLPAGLKRITHTAVQEEVARTAGLFAPFSAPASVPSHALFDASTVFTSAATRAAQQCAQFTTSAGETRANPQFFANFGQSLAQVAVGALLDVLQKQGVLSDPQKVRHLSKRIKNTGVSIVTSLLSSTFAISRAPSIAPTSTTPTATLPASTLPAAYTSATMLEQVMEQMVPAVAKAALSIVGNDTSELALTNQATYAVASRMRFMGNMLPILSTASPSLLNNVSGLISSAITQRGKEAGPTFDYDVERAGLTTMIALCENRDIVQYKSGHVMDDVITQAVERAIQYSRDNRGGSVEQVVKRAMDSFEFKGEGTKYLFEESYLRPISAQATQVIQRIPEPYIYGAPRGLEERRIPQISPYPITGEVDKITKEVLSLYSFAPGFTDITLRPTVAQTVAYVAHYQQLSHFPRNFVLELAKVAGCVAAKEVLRPGPTDAKHAVTLGLAVVAQLLIPSAQICGVGAP